MIKKVINNKDKELTYRELNKKCKLALLNNEYETLLLYSYAMIEDRLLSMLHYLYVIDRYSESLLPNDDIDKIIRPLLKYNNESDKSKVYKINNITTKINILKIFNKKNKDISPYINDCYRIIDHNIKIDYLKDYFKRLNNWIRIRNEIIHASFNKNINDLNNQLKDSSIEGYNLAKEISKYANSIKDNYKQISVRTKWNAIVNNNINNELLNYDILNPTLYFNNEDKGFLTILFYYFHECAYYWTDSKIIDYYNYYKDIKNSIINNKNIYYKFLDEIINSIKEDKYEKFLKCIAIAYIYENNKFNSNEILDKIYYSLFDKKEEAINEKVISIIKYCPLLGLIIPSKFSESNVYKNGRVDYGKNEIIYKSKNYKFDKPVLNNFSLNNCLFDLWTYEYIRNVDIGFNIYYLQENPIYNTNREIELIKKYSLDEKDFILKYFNYLDNNINDEYELNIGIAIDSEEIVKLHENKFFVSEFIQRAYFNKVMIYEKKKIKDIFLSFVTNLDDFIFETFTKDNRYLYYSTYFNNHINRKYKDLLKKDISYFISCPSEYGGNILCVLDDKYKNNKDLVLTAVKNCGYALKYASEKLRNDIDIIIESINGGANNVFFFLGDKIKRNKKIILRIINKIKNNNIVFLKYCNEEIKDDEEIVLRLVTINCKEFEYASERIKNDRNFILELIENNPNIIRVLNAKFKNDKEIVLKSIFDDSGSNLELIKYIGDDLKKDKEFLKQIVDINGSALLYDGLEILRDDKETVLKAIEFDPGVTQCISDRLKDDEDVMFLASTCGCGLEYASERLKNDEKFIMKIFDYLYEESLNYTDDYYDDEGPYFSLLYMGEKLKSNSKFMLTLMKKYGDWLPVLEFINKDIDDYKNIAKEALNKDYRSIEFLKDELKNDIDFILDIFKNREIHYSTYLNLKEYLPEKVFDELSVKLDLEDFLEKNMEKCKNEDEEVSLSDDELPF
jgi:hypothetical protein